MSGHQFRNFSPGLPILPFSRQDEWQSGGSDHPWNGSQASVNTCNTVHRLRTPKELYSDGSRGSAASPRLRVRNGNVDFRGGASQISLGPLRNLSNASSICRSYKEASPKSACENGHSTPPRKPSNLGILLDTEPLEDFDQTTDSDCDSLPSIQSQKRDQVYVPGIGFQSGSKKENSALSSRMSENTTQETLPARPFTVASEHPFKVDHSIQRWMSNLFRDRPSRITPLKVREERWTLDDSGHDKTNKPELAEYRKRYGKKKASSWSSFGFEKAARAGTTSDDLSYVDKSGVRARRSSKSRFSKRSSRLSNGTETVSISAKRTLERDAWHRAIQRRKITEEIVSSEQSHIADLKVLLHVYLTMLSSGSKAAQAAQPDVSRNVEDMLRVHEDILSQVNVFLAPLEGDSDHSRAARKGSKHVHWLGLESLEGLIPSRAVSSARRSLDTPWLRRSNHHTGTIFPSEAANVAKVFDRKLDRLLEIYEEYGAKYESMLRNMASSSKALPNWSAYERGIEALVNSLITQSSGVDGGKKGLTLEDLLIKPMQKVSRYPLLFAELYKCTPWVDDPASSAMIDKIRSRLLRMATTIDRATNDRETQIKIRRSGHLHDMLILPNAAPESFSLRLLGHPSLCGALFVVHQSSTGPSGNYMLCALFKSHLLLATPTKKCSRFKITAVISLSCMQIERAEEGRGLQCHTAPFSWKIRFQSDQQDYELILCACSAREEEEWKDAMSQYIASENQRMHGELSVLPAPERKNPILRLDIVSLGHAFIILEIITRQQSIQRAVTVDSDSRKSNRQVIIKNTHFPNDGTDLRMTVAESMNRSKTSPSAKSTTILAPKRVERHRIEQSMANVWTRDRLPYPSMASHRGEYLKTSASTVMRKLSKASTVTTSISDSHRRSVSSTSIAEASASPAHIEAIRKVWCPGSISLVPQHSETITPIPRPNNSVTPTPQPRKCVSFGSKAMLGSMGAFDSVEDSDDGMKYVTKLRGSAAGSGHIASRNGSGASTVMANASRGSLELKEIGGTAKKPKTLLKAFSTEGIRSWFH